MGDGQMKQTLLTPRAWREGSVIGVGCGERGPAPLSWRRGSGPANAAPGTPAKRGQLTWTIRELGKCLGTRDYQPMTLDPPQDTRYGKRSFILPRFTDSAPTHLSVIRKSVFPSPRLVEFLG